MTCQMRKRTQLLKFVRPRKNGELTLIRLALDISVSFLFFFFRIPPFLILKKGVDDFVFSIGGCDDESDERFSKIHRFNVRLKIWETVKIEIPQKLGRLFCIVKDDTLHCIGGINEKCEERDSYFSIKLRNIYIKNGGLLIFENWFRFYGFKTHTEDLGKIVEDYAGNLW